MGEPHPAAWPRAAEAILTDPSEGLPDALIEREAALSAGVRAIDAARAGQGAVLAIHGGPGLGKTRLLAALRAVGDERGMTVLAGAGRELEQDFAWGVVLQLFESRIASATDSQRAQLLSGAARETVPLFASGPRPAFSEQPFTLLHGLYRLCAHLADSAPLLLVIDDVDKADAASLRFILYLAERVEQLRVAVLLADGGAGGSTEPQLVEQIVGHPRTVRGELRPLSAAGTARSIRTGWFPHADDELCAAVHEVTAGNPGLIDHVRAGLLAADGSPSSADRIRGLGPPSLAAAAIRRARLAGEGGPELLRAVAVLGDRAHLRHAAALAGLEREAATRLVAPLTDFGLLLADERLTISSPLLREAIEQNQSPADRADLHLRAARLLADEEELPERVAFHLLRGPHAGSAWAVETLCAAASVALARGVPEDAIAYLRRALEEPPPPGELRAHVVLELGRAEAAAGEPQAARRWAEAIERIPDQGERTRRALDAGRTLFALGRYGDSAVALERGLAEGPGQDEAARLRAARTTVLRLARPPAGEIPPAGAVPESDGAPAAHSLLALHAFEAALRGDPSHEVLELAERALSRGALLEEETADGIGYYLAVVALVLVENLQTAEAALTAAIEDARSRGSVLAFATASCVRSFAIYSRGRVPDALADARQAVAATGHGWGLALPAARAVLAASLLEQGDLEGAWRQVESAERLVDPDDPTRFAMLACRGHLRVLRGDAKQGLADLHACGSDLEAAGVSNPAVISWRSSAARACALLGDWEGARELAERELELARAFGVPGPIGRALRGLAAVAEPAAALELLDEAVHTLDDSQAALERARALVDYGSALRRSGQRRVAREPLRNGVDLARRCGSEILVAHAMREVKAAGARPRRAALSGSDALTTRERQVADLAVAGLSNREIAEALFVTVKTVEWHLKHTYRKLGVSSRSGLPEALSAGVDEPV